MAVAQQHKNLLVSIPSYAALLIFRAHFVCLQLRQAPSLTATLDGRQEAKGLSFADLKRPCGLR